MKRGCILLCLSTLFFVTLCLTATAQTPNACGISAIISPLAADSVVNANTSIQFENKSVNAGSASWLLDGLFVGITGNSFNYQITTGRHVISLVVQNGNCTDTATVVYFAPGLPHNVTNMLQANYGTYDINEEGTSIDKTPDNGLILGGVEYLWRSCGQAGIVTKLREGGCIDWSKRFLSPDTYCNNSKVTLVHASNDGSYYVVVNDIEFVKLDKNGEIIWKTKFIINQSSVLGASLITTDPQGFVYLVSQTAYNGWIIMKLDKNGNLIYNRVFGLSTEAENYNGEFAIPYGVVWLNGSIYVGGSANINKISKYFGFLTKINPTTGDKEWQYGYTDTSYSDAMGFRNLTVYDTLLMASSANHGQTVTLINQQGEVKKSIKTLINPVRGAKITRAGADKDGHIYLMQWVEESLPLQPYFQYYTTFAKIDTSLNKYFGFSFSTSSRSYYADAVMGSNNHFSALGQNYGFVDDGIFSSRQMSLLSIDTFSTAQNCLVNENNFDVSIKNIDKINFSYLVDSSFSIEPLEASNFTVEEAYMQSRFTCPDFIDSCSFMKISGPVSLCSVSDTYTYRLHRNKNCSIKPRWSLPAGVTVIKETDSTLTVKFKSLGVYTLVSILQSCIPVKDSLVVSITSKNKKPELGRDTIICNNSSINLNAGSGFLRYKWSDASTDSILSINKAGLYWVEVIDLCGNVVRDSINVSPFYLKIDIGPDRVKCNSDTIHINAPAGFLSYQWSNNYNISSTTGQSVVVNPIFDTAYYLKAQISPGCFAFDTIKITVRTSPAINLGGDKSFCNGDSIVLDAGPSFAAYSWSTGNTSNYITVKKAGLYSVTGTTNDGCKSSDTLKVLNVWSNPAVQLNHDSTLCAGTTRLLKPGKFFIYRWQDGSTAENYTVSNTGKYFVTVTDNNYCVGSDTVNITKLLPGPSKFLFGDTTICSYGDLVLLPRQAYNVYLWNTGYTGRSLTVTKPGLYWLKVTDANNCEGIDTVKVSLKQCMNGFFMPTAFTPNNDGKNDVLKPMLFGNIVKFQLNIYNRFGQLIFSSADPLKGWDGNYKNMVQSSGTFAWVCNYQLQGETEVSTSGTVTLLR